MLTQDERDACGLKCNCDSDLNWKESTATYAVGATLPAGATLLEARLQEDSGMGGMNMYLPDGETTLPAGMINSFDQGRITVYESGTNKVLYSANFGSADTNDPSGKMRVSHYDWGTDINGNNLTYTYVEGLGVPGAFTYDPTATRGNLTVGGGAATHW